MEKQQSDHSQDRNFYNTKYAKNQKYLKHNLNLIIYFLLKSYLEVFKLI